MSRSEPSYPRIEIQIWPGLALCSALQMVLSADELPGSGEDFEKLGRAIEPALAESISLFLLTNMTAVLTDLSLQEQVTDLEPNAFLAWVEGLDAADLAARARDYAEKDDYREAVRSPKALAEDHPAEWSRAKANESQFARVRQLLKDPVPLKATAMEVLRAFWEDHFHAVYARHSDAMRRVEEILRHDPDLDHLPALIERLLGRPIQEAADWTSRHSRILLVPFPFMGPYLVSMTMDKPEAMLILAFDAERALSLLTAVGLGPDILKLKALADETRLTILRFVSTGERFGGDIVTHLGISQPGVSRHLRLLTASGLLRVRQEGTSKFYSICDAQLDAIAEGIRRMRSGSKKDEKGSTL
jgi:DNA-binding transcriptional ArsR family regulator